MSPALAKCVSPPACTGASRPESVADLAGRPTECDVGSTSPPFLPESPGIEPVETFARFGAQSKTLAEFPGVSHLW
jgi:hypothetical protein